MKKILLQSVDCDVTKDSWEHGEDPKTCQTVIFDSVGKLFDSPEALLEYVSKNYGLDILRKRDNLTAFDTRLIYQCYHDNDNNEVSPESTLFQDFKASKIDLWSASWNIYVTFVEVTEPTEDLLAEAFNVSAYGVSL